MVEREILDIGKAVDGIIKERLATVKLNESCTPVPTRICLICDKLEYEAADVLISASAWICPECKQKIGQMIGVRTDG